MTGLEQVAVAIWRCCLPGEPDLSWEDMLPNERRVALDMSRAAVAEVATIVRGHQNPARMVAELGREAAQCGRQLTKEAREQG